MTQNAVAERTRVPTPDPWCNWDEQIGWFVLGHFPTNRFRGACIRPHQYEYGDLDLLWKGKVRRAWFREDWANQIEPGVPRWVEVAEGEPGAFAVTYLVWDGWLYERETVKAGSV